MKYLLFLVILLTPFIVRADQPRFNNRFNSANDKFELRLDTGYSNWLLVEKASNKEFYKLTGDIGSMTVLISDDGKYVVAIDDYSEREPEDNSEVLIFYDNGNRIRTYKLNQVFDDTKFTSQSVSHFRWLFRNQKNFSIDDSKLNLTTFEMNNLVFDIKTGNLLKKQKDEILSDGAVYVVGQVRSLDGYKHEIAVKCVIYGNAAKGEKILFDTKDYRYEDKGRRWEGSGINEALILKNGKLLAVKGILFNRCN